MDGFLGSPFPHEGDVWEVYVSGPCGNFLLEEIRYFGIMCGWLQCKKVSPMANANSLYILNLRLLN